MKNGRSSNCQKVRLCLWTTQRKPAVNLPDDSLDTYRARIRAIGVGETAAVAREFFHADRCVIVLLGPAEDLVPQLDGLGEVTIIEP